MMNQTEAAYKFRHRILEEGVGTIKAKGLVLTVRRITNHKSVELSIDIVDEENDSIVRLCNEFLNEGHTLTILDLDEAFKVNLE